MGKLNHELLLVPCPYRNLAEAAIDFIQQKLDEDPNRSVQVVMGQLVMDTWAAQALHANTSVAFTLALQRMERVVITNVGYQIHRLNAEPAGAKHEEGASQPAQAAMALSLAANGAANGAKALLQNADEVL